MSDRILEIRFGWEPSKWQMVAAAEKLAGKVEERKNNINKKGEKRYV